MPNASSTDTPDERYLPPFDEVDAPSFDIPADACDCHAHVISESGYPFTPSRSYTPYPAPEVKYLQMLERTGMSRGVLVQVSVYGTDNRYMLSVVRKHPQRLRAVAVVAPDISDRELEQMHADGVRGVRLNVLFGGGVGFDVMETLAHRIAPLGWHMQFLLDATNLEDLMPRMQKLPCPAVIDHMGHMSTRLGVGHRGFQALLHLVREHDFWVKLSGAYRISDDFDRFADTLPFARALVEAAPERMLWGSDWPHVTVTRMPNTGRLRNLFAEWVDDPALRQQILVSNPARLYDF
jgi:2-pyrone-4,6-dicarboxylate lactonase